MSGPGRLVRSVLGLIAPPTCASCGAGVAAEHAHRFCAPCREQIGPLTQPLPELDGVAQLMAAADFEGLLALLVQRFKYSAELPLARPLAELLVETALAYDLDPDCVVPMPLHPARQRERGFDQVHLLAGPLSEALAVPRIQALARPERRRPQVGLPLTERLDNVAGAFAVAGDPSRIEGRTVLLIDDVVTTGATLAEAARALRGAGAASVDALTLGLAPKSG